MKILFIGAVEFSQHCLEQLIANGCNVIGVITRGHQKSIADWADVGLVARKNKIPVIYTTSQAEIIHAIDSSNPDVIFCIGWSQLLSQDILDKCPVIGYHPTLLPANRGRHPIVWTIQLGLEKGGSTFFVMDEGADSGDIISQTSFDIPDGSDCRWYYDEIKRQATSQIPDVLKDISVTPWLTNGQQGTANYWRKRTDKDSIIDFRMSADSIVRLFKALHPIYPGPFIDNDGDLSVVDLVLRNGSEPLSTSTGHEPGKIIQKHEDYVVVSCGNRQAISLSLRNKEQLNNLQIGDYL